MNKRKAKKKRKSKTKLSVLAAWLREHRDLWQGWRDDWTVPYYDNGVMRMLPPYYDNGECTRIWKAVVKALKQDGLVGMGTHTTDINVGKFIQKAQEHDYVGVMLAQHAEPVEHATVRVGEYVVPLIGVPKEATQEKCSHCGSMCHLADMALDAKGQPCCQTCLSK